MSSTSNRTAEVGSLSRRARRRDRRRARRYRQDHGGPERSAGCQVEDRLDLVLATLVRRRSNQLLYLREEGELARGRTGSTAASVNTERFLIRQKLNESMYLYAKSLRKSQCVSTHPGRQGGDRRPRSFGARTPKPIKVSPPNG